MSIEKAKEFLLALKEKRVDEAWAAKAAEAKTEEEKYALAADMAREMGYDVTAAELREAMTPKKKDDSDLFSLEDEDVEAVAGGGYLCTKDKRVIYGDCPACHNYVAAFFTGNVKGFLFFEQNEYKCEKCGELFWY